MGRHVTSVTVGSGEFFSEAIDMTEYNSGAILLPAAWDAAQIAFTVSPTLSGTYYPVRDAASVLVQSTVSTANWHALPEALFDAALFTKLWSQTAGTSVTQTADRAISVILIK